MKTGKINEKDKINKKDKIFIQNKNGKNKATAHRLAIYNENTRN